MPTQQSFAAEMLRSSASGLASLAVERLIPRLEVADEALGSLPARAWHEQLTELLSDLARALGDGHAGVFLARVGWHRAAFAARELSTAELRASVECLTEVVRDELPEDAAASALALLEKALASFDEPPLVVPPALLPTGDHAQLTASYLVALLEGDRLRATRLLLDPLRAGTLSVRDALLHVCAPAQREVGRMWHLNEITIGEEHAVSAATVRVMSQLMSCAPEVEPTGKTVLAASIGDDAHDIGLRLVSELFELDGWRVVFLGSRLPATDFAWSVRAFMPDLALLSASTDEHRRSVTEAITLLRADGDAPPVLVGGPGFEVYGPEGGDELWRASGADAGAVGATDAVRVGRRLVGLDAGG